MTLPFITPAQAKAQIDRGTATLVDVREPMEHARESVPGAVSIPLSKLAPDKVDEAAPGAAIIFHCQSGRRTAENAERLAGCGGGRAFILEGGLNGWKSAGYATAIDRTKPIDLQRQVQIAAGSLILAGLGLALAVSPWLLAIPAFVGGGLVFAGISGWCGMANLLAVMPWNRSSG